LVFIIAGVLSTTSVIAQVTANPPSDLVLCDDNNDGLAIFNLTVTEPEIIGGQVPTNLVLFFYVTQADADSNMNPIVTPNAYYNSVNPQTIYARLENTSNGEFDTTNFNLLVYLPPITVTVSYLIGVDEDGDGFTAFNLISKDLEILNGQTNIILSYFESIQNANNNVNVIVSPTSYINTTNPQTIYVRLESIETSCFAVTEFDLVTVEALIAEEPEDITIDEGDDNGIAVFDLTVNEPQLLGDQDPFIFLF
jgi:hypothetical protein